MSEEVWKPVPGFANYEASSEGRIRNVKLGHVLTGTVTRKGYRQVSVRGVKKRSCQFVHRLVAAAFFGPAPPGHVVNHLNAVKLDNRIQNIEYTTPAGNVRHAQALGLLRPGRVLGERNPRSKLTADRVREMRAQRQQGASLTLLGNQYGITPRAAHLVVTRRVWKHVA